MPTYNDEIQITTDDGTYATARVEIHTTEGEIPNAIDGLSQAIESVLRAQIQQRNG